MGDRPRSLAATIVGWVIVAALLFWFLGIVVGTIRLLIRFIVWVVVLGALVTLYLNLRAPDD
jgi:hypothetical protein